MLPFYGLVNIVLIVCLLVILFSVVIAGDDYDYLVYLANSYSLSHLYLHSFVVWSQNVSLIISKQFIIIIIKKIYKAPLTGAQRPQGRIIHEADEAEASEPRP